MEFVAEECDHVDVVTFERTVQQEGKHTQPNHIAEIANHDGIHQQRIEYKGNAHDRGHAKHITQRDDPIAQQLTRDDHMQDHIADVGEQCGIGGGNIAIGANEDVVRDHIDDGGNDGASHDILRLFLVVLTGNDDIIEKQDKGIHNHRIGHILALQVSLAAQDKDNLRRNGHHADSEKHKTPAQLRGTFADDFVVALVVFFKKPGSPGLADGIADDRKDDLDVGRKTVDTGGFVAVQRADHDPVELRKQHLGDAVRNDGQTVGDAEFPEIPVIAGAGLAPHFHQEVDCNGGDRDRRADNAPHRPFSLEDGEHQQEGQHNAAHRVHQGQGQIFLVGIIKADAVEVKRQDCGAAAVEKQHIQRRDRQLEELADAVAKESHNGKQRGKVDEVHQGQ